MAVVVVVVVTAVVIACLPARSDTYPFMVTIWLVTLYPNYLHPVRNICIHM